MDWRSVAAARLDSRPLATSLARTTRIRLWRTTAAHRSSRALRARATAMNRLACFWTRWARLRRRSCRRCAEALRTDLADLCLAEHWITTAAARRSRREARFERARVRRTADWRRVAALRSALRPRAALLARAPRIRLCRTPAALSRFSPLRTSRRRRTLLTAALVLTLFCRSFAARLLPRMFSTTDLARHVLILLWTVRADRYSRRGRRRRLLASEPRNADWIDRAAALSSRLLRSRGERSVRSARPRANAWILSAASLFRRAD